MNYFILKIVEGELRSFKARTQEQAEQLAQKLFTTYAPKEIELWEVEDGVAYKTKVITR